MTKDGTVVALGNRIGAGGEGAVYDIVGYQDWVVKIYHRPVKPEKVAKLRLMAQLATDNLMRVAAWPRGLVYDRAGPNAMVCGVILRRIKQARAIHELYSPTHRRDHFPKADWRFLVRTARNCARAFAGLHNHGIVIGDVNQGNLLVSTSAEVRFIDCDSFQISRSGEIHFCQVGVPHFTPPELHSVNLSSVARTQHHDGFGLAVLIFHLLFMGRHPFSGRYLGSGDMPIERAIRESRFPYGANARRNQMEPPPDAILLDHISAPIGQLFERAFTTKIRPAAPEWDKSLEEFETQLCQCARDPGHYHYTPLKICPWCHIVGQGGPNFFISVTVQVFDSRNSTLDVDGLWSDIDRVPPPELQVLWTNSTQGKRFRPTILPADIRHGLLPQKLTGALALFGIALTWCGLIYPAIAALGIPVTLVFAIYWYMLCRNSPLESERRNREVQLSASEKDLREHFAKRERLIRSKFEQFASEKERLAGKHRELRELATGRVRELTNLSSNVRQRQLESYLDSVYISNAHIRGIGAAKQAALQSYGIETALDITWRRVKVVPGFGASLAAALVAWRQSIEGRFVFDATKGVQHSDRATLEARFQQQAAVLKNLLIAGKYALPSLTRSAEAELNAFDQETSALERAVAQARADLTAASVAEPRVIQWILKYLYPSYP